MHTRCPRGRYFAGLRAGPGKGARTAVRTRRAAQGGKRYPHHLRWTTVAGSLSRHEQKHADQTKPGGLTVKAPGEVDAPTTEARRAKLMPFLWKHAAKMGSFYGNQDKGSIVHVSNNMWFSYPGYNELATGHPDDERVTSNKRFPNPNGNVFEWLNKAPTLKGKVVSVAEWDNFRNILNAKRGKFTVIGTHGDNSLTSFAAYLKENKPRVSFLGFSRTDHEAHQGDYPSYLAAAHDVDERLGQLWDLLQSMPQYRDKTTIIFTADHGRGNRKAGPEAWRSHGRKVAGSNGIYVIIWGPDTPNRGEVSGGPEIKQAQVAATVAAALGYDYAAAQPKAAPAIKQAFK